jgi:hypothetical protein
MELVGVIALWRREVRPFTEKQVALLRTLSLRGSLKMAA